MPAQKILQLGNPLLREISLPVENIQTDETQFLIQDLADTLQAFRDSHSFGRGIAAPQIGILRRVIYVNMEPPGFSGPLINPEVIEQSGSKMEVWDNCFSFPDLVVKVKRSADIKVKYLDMFGQEQQVLATSDLSELLQHEVDHLDGILAVQRALSPASFMTFDEWQRQGKPKH